MLNEDSFNHVLNSENMRLVLLLKFRKLEPSFMSNVPNRRFWEKHVLSLVPMLTYFFVKKKRSTKVILKILPSLVSHWLWRYLKEPFHSNYLGSLIRKQSLHFRVKSLKSLIFILTFPPIILSLKELFKIGMSSCGKRKNSPFPC